jgi:hypothetical protein
MSQLGDLIRLSPRTRAEMVADRATTYDRMTGFAAPERLELDWEWRLFRDLMGLAGWRVNPFSGGAPFPSAESHWDDYCAQTLDPAQVAGVAARLRDEPFATLAPHLPAALAPDTTWLAERHELLAGRYPELVEFYRAAAENGECTVFWAA